VHTHSSKAGVLGRWAAWIARDPEARRPPAIVHTIHGPPFMPVEGNAIKRSECEERDLHRRRALRGRALRRDRLRRRRDDRQFRARGIGRDDQYETVRSGMDTEPYTSSPPARTAPRCAPARAGAESDFVIGTVARLAEHKGHDDLLDALGDDLAGRPDWKLLWVGDGWWRDRLLSGASERWG
jgi:glycosyltransferase involved in cell wall biosynthesis